ncbi:MAG: hypothetical protein ABUS79_30470, partial [Pseudomonadota bacterium]
MAQSGGAARWSAVLFALVAATTLGPAARAEKKKPGLFDFQTWKTPAGHQRDAVQQLAPQRLDHSPAATFSEPPRVLRLRVYADRDHRRMVLRWQQGIRTQVNRINRVVEPVFGVRFEIESLKDWDASHVGMPFDPILADLRKLDAGRDVDWVLGLVTPFRGLATSIHQIGGATLLGRHLVLRGMDDEQEGLAIDREFNLLSPAERQRMYEDRKIHKETVLFLHEWAHTMGALHEESDPAIMNPLYDAQRSAFSYFEKDLILFVLEHRLADPATPNPEAAGLPALLAKAPPTEGTDKERAELLALAAYRARAGWTSAGGAGDENEGSGEAGRGGERVRLNVPEADRQVFNQVVAALNDHHSDQAWAALGPLLPRQSKQATVQALACSLVTLPAAAAEARAACDRAITLDPKDTRAPFSAAAAFLTARDPTHAAPYVALGLPRIPEGDHKTWAWAASLATGVGALSGAETAIEHLPQGDADRGKLAQELEALRMRVALAPGTSAPGVPVDQEGAYVSKFEETERTVSASRVPGGQPATARTAVVAFGKSFPDTAGADLLFCEVELAARREAAAIKHCEAALVKFPRATRAHYLLGFLAAHQRHGASAEKHLRRAILL